MTAEPTRDPQNGLYRPGVGIMLLNRCGEVLVARRNDVPYGAWQMPQGGIDEGEAPRTAAFRELKEEIGTDEAVVVAEVKNWLRYDLPAEVIASARHPLKRGQRQKWFVMRFTGNDGDINLETENPEFDAWKWVPVAELADLIVSFKRQLYIDIVAEYSRSARGLIGRLAELMADPIVQMTMTADSVTENELFDLLGRVAENLRREHR
jgi:putative (di)nucleoside polyphosphate hydrolase